MLLTLIAAALAGPVATPIGEDPAAWRAPLELAGLAGGVSAGSVTITATAAGYRVVVVDPKGITHLASVPAGPRAREEVAQLAASLLNPTPTLLLPALPPGPPTRPVETAPLSPAASPAARTASPPARTASPPARTASQPARTPAPTVSAAAPPATREASEPGAAVGTSPGEVSASRTAAASGSPGAASPSDGGSSASAVGVPDPLAAGGPVPPPSDPSAPPAERTAETAAVAAAASSAQSGETADEADVPLVVPDPPASAAPTRVAVALHLATGATARVDRSPALPGQVGLEVYGAAWSARATWGLAGAVPLPEVGTDARYTEQLVGIGLGARATPWLTPLVTADWVLRRYLADAEVARVQRPRVGGGIEAAVTLTGPLAVVGRALAGWDLGATELVAGEEVVGNLHPLVASGWLGVRLSSAAPARRRP